MNIIEKLLGEAYPKIGSEVFADGNKTVAQMMNQKKHKKTHNQAVKPQSANGKPDAEYLNYKVVAKEGGSTMILSSGLSKCNAKSLENTLNSYINNKHSNVPGAGKTSVKFITIH